MPDGPHLTRDCPGGTRPTRRRRVGATIAALGLLAVAAAGCGGGEEPAPTRSTAATTTAATAPLPDGEHFGYIRSMPLQDGAQVVVFDVAEWYSGEAANVAAREDGSIGDGEVVPNDYYIRNADEGTVTLPLAGDATVRRIDCRSNCAATVPGTVAGLAASFGHEADATLTDDYRGAASQYRVTVASGAVTAIEEVYVP